MATISIFTTTLLLLLATFSAAVHGRESQFFAKVSNNPQESQSLNTNTQESLPLNTNQQDSQNGDSYGLYGHESGQLPPSATTNNHLPANLPENYNPVAYTTPIHSNTQNLPNEFNEPQAFQYNGDNEMYNSEKQEIGTNGGNMYNSEKQEMGTNGGNMYNSEKQGMVTNGGNMYNSGKQGMSDTRFLEKGRYFYAGDNGYNPSKQGMFMETAEDGGDMYNSQKQENGRYNSEKQESGRYNQGQEMYNSQMQENGRYNQGGQEMYNSRKQGNNGNMYNTEKQGMSDTRFLENGKYYYDLNSENLNANANMNSKRFEYNNNKGYYGNNDVNSYERYNSNGGYQNQDEFQENQDDQFNP